MFCLTFMFASGREKVLHSRTVHSFETTYAIGVYALGLNCPTLRDDYHYLRVDGYPLVGIYIYIEKKQDFARTNSFFSWAECGEAQKENTWFLRLSRNPLVRRLVDFTAGDYAQTHKCVVATEIFGGLRLHYERLAVGFNFSKLYEMKSEATTATTSTNNNKNNMLSGDTHTHLVACILCSKSSRPTDYISVQVGWKLCRGNRHIKLRCN